MDIFLFFFLPIITIELLFFGYRYHKKQQRRTFIANYRFGSPPLRAVRLRYPHLDDKSLLLVIRALRDYFTLCLESRTRMVAMPSQVVDEAWHTMILSTRSYDDFCKQAFGKFLHHTPAEAMNSSIKPQESIRNAWRLACKHEGINHIFPNKLPLLFGIDAMLGISDGFAYTLDCHDGRDGYCASNIGCSGGSCGGDSGENGGGSSSDGDGSGDGSGSSGCGSGCSGG